MKKKRTKKPLQVRKLDLSDPEVRAEYERIREKIRKQLQPVIDAIHDSQRLTAADYAVTINCTRIRGEE